METWFIIIVSLCISALLKSTFTTLWSSKKYSNSTTGTEKKLLPPGPPSVPLIGNLIWLRRSIRDMESILRELKTRYSSLITMKIGPQTVIFISDHTLAHRALVQNGAVCSDRPAPLPTSRILNLREKMIASAAYGPTWRLLRRNLTREILNPTRVRSHSGSRRWVLSVLVNRILEADDQLVRLIDHFQYANFCLLAVMCFGKEGLHEEQIKAIESVQLRLVLGTRRFGVLNLLPPRLSKIFLRRRWKELLQLREEQHSVFIPLIKARLEMKQQRDDKDVKALAYVDTLVDLQLPEENGRKLDEWEMVSLCNEFLIGGTDTTSSTLQWIMANLVKYPHLQAKLYEEIISVVGPPPPLSKQELVAVEEEVLHKMPYLKAVVLEGLRRHPPAHFLLPHKVTQDVELDGYVVPKNAIVNFMVADMNCDPNVWKDPLEFKPERFLELEAPFDVTGSKEIKMMPFGAGRRICPAWSLGLLHLEYFVANLIWLFEWTSLPGEVIDLSEKQELAFVMKNALRARISRRSY